LIAKRRQERMKQNGGNWKSNQPQRQVNVHKFDDLVNVDTLIDYAIMNHDVVPPISTEETTDASPANADRQYFVFDTLATLSAAVFTVTTIRLHG
jgi:hypothetical protein